MNITKSAYLIPVFVFLIGCSSAPKIVEPSLDGRNNETVATDFVSALSTLRGHAPKNTMLQFRPSQTEFGVSLMREMRNAGYGIQTIAATDLGPMLVTYEADAFENTNYESVAYRVRVGSVELGREYEIRAGNIFPVTSLSVTGVQISSQPLDESHFARVTVREREAEDRGPWLTVPDPLQVQSQPTPSNNQLARPLARVTVPELFDEEEPANNAERPSELENITILGESNSASLFKEYKPVVGKTIVFPNDSLRLGNKGKAVVRKIVDGYNPNTDVFSVIGCSHGKTTLVDGNRKLALGRAERIIDELLTYNVLASNILDEGCWAGLTVKDLPHRGVILTLRRKTGPA